MKEIFGWIAVIAFAIVGLYFTYLVFGAIWYLIINIILPLAIVIVVLAVIVGGIMWLFGNKK